MAHRLREPAARGPNPEPVAPRGEPTGERRGSPGGGDFAAVALPYLDRIHALARSVARPPLDPDELTQETFARACAAFHRFTPESDVRAWLTTILLNLVRGEARRRRLEVVPLSDAVAPPEESSDVIALRNLDRSAVVAGLWRLPEDFRLAIALVDLVGLSVRDAAGVLGVPPGTVLSRLSRGRARLGRLLAVSQGEQG